MKKLLNFHCHKSSKNQEVVEILCSPTNCELPTWCQGIHPWLLDAAHYHDQISQLEIDSDCLMFGEIGLDRLKGPSLQMQQSAVIQQLEIARKLDLACVFHNVRCSSEIIQLRKNKAHQSMRSWVLHDFQGSYELATSLFEMGFYISLSPKIMNSKHKLHRHLDSLSKCPVFLETDDQDPQQIFELYDFFCNSTGLEKKHLLDLHWSQLSKLTGWSYERILAKQSRTFTG